MQHHVWPLGLAALLLSPVFLQAQPASIPLATPAAPPSSAEPAELTLDQALALAAARHPSLRAAQLEIDAQDGSVQQAGARPNPELSAQLEDFRSSTRTTTATIGFPLELGGKRAARVTAAERGRDVARAELSNARAQLSSAVISAFFHVLVAQERVRLTASSVDLAVRGADVAARRVAAGRVSPVDETRARVEQANAELELAEARAELLGAKRVLAAQWGAPTFHFGQARGDLDTLPARAGLETLFERLQDSPLLAGSRLELERRRAGVAVENSKRYPDLTVTVGARRDNELGRTQAVVGLSVPLPFFDRNQGNLHEAGKRVEKAEEEYRVAQLRLSTELSQATTQLDIARASAQTLRTAVLPAAQRAFDAAVQGFEAGKFSLLDVLDAQRTLLQARVRHLAAVANAYQAATTIDRLLGL